MAQSGVQRAATQAAEREAQVGRVGPVSAVVVNYNGESYLEACVRSIEALEGAVDEIVIVENASTDQSLSVINTHFRGVEVLRMKTNVGACVARNVGLRAAKHRWVLLVDNDVVLAPDVLGKLRAAAEARTDAVMLQPRSVFAHEPERVHYDGGDFHYAGLIALRNFYRPLAQAEGEGVVDVDCAISLCVLVDKKAVLEAGGFDEEYFILFEDLDLSYRLRMAGMAILSVEDAIVRHDSGTAGISFREGTDYPARRVFFHSRNRWLFMAKCFRLWTLFLALPALIVYESAWILFVTRQGQLGAWLRGKRAFFGHLRVLRRKRRNAQRRRQVGDRELLVGGPLTLTPTLESGGGGTAARILDGVLRTWWALVRWLVV